jgi:valyl-tRNA synthetase
MLKLLHPFMPFVTEEIYQRMPFRKDESIMIAPFPRVGPVEIDEESESQMTLVMGIIDAIRNIRGEMGFPPSTKVDVQIRANGHRPLVEEYAHYIKELARVSGITFATNEAPRRAAIALFKEIEIFVSITDMGVVQREQVRVEKELSKIGEEIDRAFNKINNRAFREKAPEAILKKEETNFEELRTKREKLLASKGMLEELLRG